METQQIARKEIIKKRDLSLYTLFNYCNKEDLKYFDELKEHIVKSSETGNHLLVRLLDLFKKWLPDDEYAVVAKELRTVAKESREIDSDNLSRFVTGTPLWEGWTKDEAIVLKNAKVYTASHFSFLVINALLEKEF
ncbi:hypothetical protein IKE97_01330 [Candidatus Saccharibacteria bacterium]|nr:hypothetical protein [Candidatus Saccharibacteria bacterium]